MDTPPSEMSSCMATTRPKHKISSKNEYSLSKRINLSFIRLFAENSENFSYDDCSFEV
jgi:hypothetical protein